MSTVEVTPLPFESPENFRRRPKCKGVAERFTDEELDFELMDASQFILDVCPSATEASPATLARIVCDVVRRALDVPDDLVGMESATETAGQVSLALRPSNPHGDYYLTRGEKRALGMGSQAWSVDLLAGG